LYIKNSDKLTTTQNLEAIVQEKVQERLAQLETLYALTALFEKIKARRLALTA
jgi:hypothetical protein